MKHKEPVVWAYTHEISPDSIYTERYMNLPSLNPGGYVNASISNMTGFDSIDFLLAHGSGDDNVHFANSAHLLDMLTTAHVRGFQFRMFTDRYANNFFRWQLWARNNLDIRSGLRLARDVMDQPQSPGPRPLDISDCDGQ